MKLTKKLEAEVMKAYNAYWNSYLKGDMKTMASFLDDDINVIGSTETEVFYNKKAVLKFYKATAGQVAGTAQFRNRDIKIELIDGLVLITEKLDFYVLIDGKWTFYAKGRLSSLLSKKEDGWKFIQQHGSMPDTRAGEGEQFSVEKISKENLELRDAIKRRTIELENKNRELEIETALEKVRAVAMGMKKPDDMLDMCQIISGELQKLGVPEIRNIQTAIIDLNKEAYLNYEYFRLQKKKIITAVEYKKQKDVHAFVKRMSKDPEGFFTTQFKGASLKQYIHYQVKAGQFVDPATKKATSLHYYFYSIGPGALGISTYTPLTKDAIALFKRFRNVFQLAYRRFIDIEKAIAQAREAQIELALERVRAGAMAMRQSAELGKLIFVLYQELTKLDAQLDRCFIMIVHPENKGITWWLAGKEGLLAENGFFIQMNQHPSHLMYLDCWQQRKKKWQYLFEGKEKKDWDRFGFNKTELVKLPEFIKQDMAGMKKIYLSGSSDTFGSLVTGSLAPLAEEHQDIISRFTIVFNQSYTRFLDLQKAEAQTREADIELALERVRARTMAMQHSDELSETVAVMFEQFKALGEEPERMAIEIVNEKENVFEIWATQHGGAQLNLLVKISLDEPHVMQKMYTAWKAKIKSITIDLQGNELEEYFTFLKNKGLPVQRKIFGKRRVQTVATFSKGILTIITPEPRPQETIDLLERFAVVFQQTYTRFLDLQKAEAQAREAQIETALERVRARSMAMHRSSELKEVALELRKQMGLLGQKDLEVCAIHLYGNDENYFESWSAMKAPGKEGEILQTQARFPNKGIKIVDELIKHYSNKSKDYILVNDGEKISEWFKVMKSNAPELHASIMQSVGKLPVKKLKAIWSVADFAGGALVMVTYGEPDELSRNLLRRSANVFEQAYVRFVDLQKAEAQAREAKIEAALERVRSRSMAMNKTEELKDVIQVIFEQMLQLNFKIHSASFALDFDETFDFNTLIASKRQTYPTSVRFPSFNHPVFNRLLEVYKNGDDFFSDKLTFEEKNAFFLHFFKYTPEENYPNELQEYFFNTIGYARSTVIIKPIVLMIVNNDGIEFSETENNILKRIAKVFEQSHIRFLDLQKAEAQAREAQIEAALERIRSRSMAMQKSGELGEVKQLVFEQFQKLNIKVDGFSLLLDFGKTKDWIIWAAAQGGIYNDVLLIPYIDNPAFNTLIDTYHAGLDFYTGQFSFEEKNELFDHYFRYSGDVPEERKKFIFSSEGTSASTYFLKNSVLRMHNFTLTPYTAAENEVLKRIAYVFEQSYTRFLDLQKAEAQAREAQIQLSLERVRARAMAMHKSEELGEAAILLYRELQTLGIETFINCGYVIIDETNNIQHAWMTHADGTIREGHLMPLSGDWIMNERYERWRRKEPVFYQQVGGEQLKEHIIFVSGNTAITESTEKIFSIMPDPTFFYFGSFSEGYLHLLADKKLSKESEIILSRFTGVFEITYRRFLDLQKAEAQAREAQIELGLERVRARAMAMQKSDELSELVDTVFKELTKLDFALTWCIINIINESSMSNTVWAANPDISKAPESYHMLFEDYPFHDAMMKGWKERKTKSVYTVEGDEKRIYDDYLFSETEFKRTPEAAQAASRAMEKYVVSFSFSNFGGLQTVGDAPLSDANLDILSRFGKVFDLTYTRFNDLKQAEAQVRESQIQLALERVRARTMAMQHSDELKEAAALLFQQVKALGVPAYSCGYNIWEKNDKTFTSWMSTQDGSDFNGVPDIPLTEDANFIRYVESKQNGKPFFVLELRGERMQEHYQYLKTIPAFKAWFDYAISVGFDLPQTQIHHLANFSQGNLLFITLEPCSEFHDLFKRFAAVFEQTYTRFLDLQKAEAQVREALIEASLERVRSKTMAMHNSQDVGDTVATMFDELVKLGVKTVRCGVGIMQEPYQMEVWTAKKTDNEKAELIIGRLDMTKHPLMQGMFDGWRNKDITFSYELRGQDLVDYSTVLNNSSDYKINYDIASLPQQQFKNDFYFNEGALFSFSTEQLSAEAFQLFKRFAGVFGQTYRRYLDLQKAEAQAREAQIELGLERVRARAMAMQNSNELAELVDTVFKELTKLHFALDRCILIIIDEKTVSANYWMANPESRTPASYHLLLKDIPYLVATFNAWKERKTKMVYDLNGDEKSSTVEYIFSKTTLKHLPAEVKEGMKNTNQIFLNASFNNFGGLQADTVEPMSEENLDILYRFAKVFDLTYTRFNDLQKAEAQAREATIELALERVRAKAMAMHSSRDVAETIGVFYRELRSLSVTPLRCGVAMIDKETRMAELTTMNTTEEGDSIEVIGNIKMAGHPVLDEVFEHWLLQKEYHAVLKGNEINEYYQVLKPQILLPDYPHDIIQFGYYFMFAEGDVYAWTDIELEEDELKIYRRFSSVISLTYKRYKDLRQAEAQAREAQIEAALERVRSRSMAMHKSEELADVSLVLFEQVEHLGIKTWGTGFNIWLEGNTSYIDWVVNSATRRFMEPYKVDLTAHPLFSKIIEAKKRNDDFFVLEFEGESLVQSYRLLFKMAKIQFEQVVNSGFQMPTRQINHYVFGSRVSLMFITYEPCPEAHDIFKRFGNVFEQTYTRFLDLQKAEAQAREAQVETALERVRSRSMAMHQSNDLHEVIKVVADQIAGLGLQFNTASFTKVNANGSWDMWIFTHGQAYPAFIHFPYINSPVFNLINQAILEGLDFVAGTFTYEEKNIFFDHFFKNTIAINTPAERKEYVLKSKGLAISAFLLKNINLFFTNYEGTLFSKEEDAIFRRFAGVFEQAYTRFLDLEKAEAQTREATIETALEKVRGKAMAMHNSNDLIATASVVFTELRKLGIHSFRSGVGLLTKENRHIKFYSATSSEEGDSLSVVGSALLDGHPILSKTYDSWVSNEDYFPVLEGETLRTYYEKVVATFTVPIEQAAGFVQYGCFLPFSEGVFYGWSENAYSAEEVKVLKRFAAVIDLTFRRYIELQKSETNAREAVKQAALDRVRADIASMRTIADLDRITPLIWNELTILGVPFIRCGVFIMDEVQRLIHTFLSTPDGKAIAAFHLPYDISANYTIMINNWRHKKLYMDHWGKVEFINLAEELVRQGAIENKEQYLNTLPDAGFFLHLLPFLQGMLYVGNTTQLGEEEIQLIQSVADAFSTAYARYEDFNKLEAAKQQVDKTLTDLKLTQAQLVQAEKMASLGELTAGIAHEIQNPLNFVNNFSDVNQELLVEMKDELEKGNLEDVKQIADDVIANEQKINHHGKRAADIVKGMLQHSRSSSGVKEPTDINALCDEYLRLSYHGLRAKDKSFNATMITEYDESIGKINIIPQDIGRVILNLINNAFYAAPRTPFLPFALLGNPQGGFSDPDYKHVPTVWVSTKKVSDKVFVSVRDNGPGIPKKILDKIFQPFFTTKPTGQGTGLGLSLSYDIVKAHGGELKVETKEGEGSTFIIQLPVNTSANEK